MIDISEPNSPGWYLKRLSDKLVDRQPQLEKLFARYEGHAEIPESIRAAPDSAQQFYRVSRTTFAELIVKAVKYPLKIQSVGTTLSQTDSGDDTAWRMFRRSGMKTEVDDVHRTALVARDGYAIVSMYPPGRNGRPRYTSEDPRQVVTIHDPVVQSEIVAAAKIFYHSEDRREYGYLYRPGRVWRAYRDRKTTPLTTVRFSPSAWDWDEAYGGEDGIPLPDGFEDVMPVLRYRNEEGVSEFERHMDLLDRIDHLVLQGMTIATLQAFKQRAIKVSPEDMPDEDEHGREIDYTDAFLNDPGALWKLPETADIWESGAVDLTPVWTGVDKAIQQLSAVTFTPLSMFSPEGQNQTAEGAGLAREGRTFKIEDRQDRFGEEHARALSLLFRLDGDESRSQPENIDIVWRPAERYSLAEKADAAVKARTAEMPWRTRMTKIWQFTPAEVTKMEAERRDDRLLQQVQDALARQAAEVQQPPEEEPEE